MSDVNEIATELVNKYDLFASTREVEYPNGTMRADRIIPGTFLTDLEEALRNRYSEGFGIGYARGTTWLAKQPVWKRVLLALGLQ